MDVTDPASITKAAEAVGDLSLLVNNAGTAFAAPVLTASLDDARREMEVNYFGTWAVTQAFAPALARNDGGAVINMLSAASWLALEQAPGYAASKAAQWSLSNAMRLALRSQGTRVLGVHVGYVDTDLSARVDQPKISTEEVARAAIKHSSPAKKKCSLTSSVVRSRPHCRTTSPRSTRPGEDDARTSGARSDHADEAVSVAQ